MEPRGSAASPFFQLRSASVAFGGRTVLSGLDVAVRAGEAVVVVGPSGAGKTTLLRLLNATVRPSGGEVWVGGVDLARLGPRDLRRTRARIGFVHQEPSLVPVVRVSQNVIAGKLGQRGFAAALRSILRPSRADLALAFRLLERVGVAEKLFQRTDTLSGGQKQRVALARALFQEPAALLADEPVASVDPARGRDLIELVLEVARERGLTLVASLHDLTLARELFPRMIGVRGGRVVLDAPPEQVSELELTRLYRLDGAPDDGGDG